MTLPTALGRIARDSFFQFIVLGLSIWGVNSLWQSHRNHYTIHISPAERQRIATSYSQQFGRTPTPDQLRNLMDRYVREEIFLREGLALGLAKDDEIVRRRIVQKYEFLQTDLASADSPTPAELQAWFQRNKASYLRPPAVVFSHVYFSPDRDGEQAARTRAAAVLEELCAKPVSRAPERGDAFPGPSDVGGLPQPEAARFFGHSELSERLFKAPVAQWSGPYRSGYGWHLIYVTNHLPAELPAWPEIQGRVLADYQEEQRRLLNERGFEKLKAKYTVRYEEDDR